MVEKGVESAPAKMYPLRYRYLEKETVTYGLLQITKLNLQAIKKVSQCQPGYFYIYSWNTSQPDKYSKLAPVVQYFSKRPE